MSDNRTAVAQASIQLLGSIAGYDVAANAVNLGLLAFEPLTRKRLISSIQGRITQEMKRQEYASLKRDDREAVLGTLLDTIKSVRINERIVRLSNDPVQLKKQILKERPQLQSGLLADPVAGPCFDALMSTVVDFIAIKIRDDARNLPIRVDEVIKDHNRLRKLASEDRREIERLSSAFDSLGATIDDIHSAASVAGLPTPSLASISARPAPKDFVGRKDVLATVNTAVGFSGVCWIAGPPMSGRYEVARQWCLENRNPDHAWLIFSDTESKLHLGISALAARLGVADGSDPAQTLARICRDSPMITVLLADLPNPDFSARFNSYHAPDCGAVVGTILSAREIENCIEMPRLNSGEIAEILNLALVGDKKDVKELASELTGEPLAARQAIDFIKNSGCSVADYSAILRKRPEVALRRQQGTSESRTAPAVWQASLERVRDLTGRDARLALSIVKILQGRAIEGAWHASIATLLTGSSDLGEVAEALDLGGALRSLGLVTADSGLVTSSPTLVNYCWANLTDLERSQVVVACLRAARMAAAHGRVSLGAGAVNAVSWITWVDFAEIRHVDPPLFDDTVQLVAAFLIDVDMLEHAHSILFKLSLAQEEDPAADRLQTAVQLGHVLRRSHYSQVEGYVALLEQYLGIDQILQSGHRADFYVLAGRIAWTIGPYEECGKYAELALSAVQEDSRSGRMNPDDTLLLTANSQRLLGWFQVALGDDVEVGIHSLLTGLELLESDKRFTAASREYRASTATFLIEQGVPLPPQLDSAKHRTEVLDAHALDTLPSLFEAQEAVARGDLAAATALLGSGPTVAFDDLYNVITRAEHGQNKVRIALDGIDTVAATRIERDGVNIDLVGEFAPILPEVEELLQLLEALPESARALPRVELLHNGITVNKSVVLRELGRTSEAIALATDALVSDRRILGRDHAECAHDAFALAGHYLAARDKRQAVKHLREARKIYGSRGPFRDVPKLRQVELLLHQLGSRNR